MIRSAALLSFIEDEMIFFVTTLNLLLWSTNVGGTNPEKVVYDVCQKVIHWVRNFPSNFFSPFMPMVRDLSCSLIDICGSFTELHVPENEYAQCSNLFLYSRIQTLQSVTD